MVENILKYKKSEDDYYSVLGCNELSTVEQICTEFKARVVHCHPDKNLSDLNAAEQFAKLQRAKEVLSDEKLRSQYDAWRRSGIAIPFNDWIARKVFTSMHWCDGHRKTPMLTENSQQTTDPNETENRNSSWNRNESDIVQLFRSYNI